MHLCALCSSAPPRGNMEGVPVSPWGNLSCLSEIAPTRPLDWDNNPETQAFVQQSYTKSESEPF